MTSRPTLKTLALCAFACGTVLASLGAASAQDDPGQRAIDTRQGYMDVVSWGAGPLFGMAKGTVDYDAAKASAAAADLAGIASVNYTAMFPEGTSKEDRPGKTRTLPDAWKDSAGFQKAFDDFRAAVAKVAAEAGKGKDELTAAVGDLGKSCGGCHKPFRAEDF